MDDTFERYYLAQNAIWLPRHSENKPCVITYGPLHIYIRNVTQENEYVLIQ